MRKSHIIPSILAGLAAVGGGTAAAQDEPLGSQYTRIDEACVESQLPDEPVYEAVCPGLDGWLVHILSGEHGSASAYARPGMARSGYINAPMRGLYGGFHAVVEWRLDGGEAFATIHRYVHHNTPDVVEFYGGIEEPNTLIVTALAAEGGYAVCPVAFVDASALPDANLIARSVADDLARGWDCGNEPVRFNETMPDLDAYFVSLGSKRAG
ncbi:hypothetical protein [Maricaulis sp.]|uniref:hypothetical protein n=1 Tax=Maricaulis sp. TaxID=1486257 RepID=UPI002B267896|nr:hypothetical protein [Maricaulis sp.]